MPAHHSNARKLNKAAARRKTRFCRYFLTEEGCTNGDSCPFAHNKDELVEVAGVMTETTGNFGLNSCSFSDDSTSICSDESCPLSLDSSSVCDSMDATFVRPRWADVRDEEDSELQSTWAPYQQQPVMREFSMAPIQSYTPPSACPPELHLAKRERREKRENVMSAANARRAALADAVLGQLLRQAQGPDVYQD